MTAFLKLMSVPSSRLSNDTLAWLCSPEGRRDGHPAIAALETRDRLFLYAHDDNASEPSAHHAPEGEYPEDLWTMFTEAREAGCDWILVKIEDHTDDTDGELRSRTSEGDNRAEPVSEPEDPRPDPRVDDRAHDEDEGEGEIPAGIEI